MILEKIAKEYAHAIAKYPQWPEDLIHQVSIMNEEAGESIRAALNHVYHDDPLQDVENELVQTATMCIRCLEWIELKNKE